MRILFFGLISSALVQGCSASKSAQLYTQFDSVKVDGSRPTPTTNGKYVDKDIEILATYFGGLNGKIVLRFKNFSKSNIRVIWDEFSFVDPYGSNHKTLHSKIRYITSSTSQPPSTIVSGGELEDHLTNLSNIHFSDGWVDGGMLGHLKGPDSIYKGIPNDGRSYYVRAAADEKWFSQELKGRNLMLLAVLEIGGKKRDYLLNLRIDHFGHVDP